ncbi:succinate-semialdehyde dehydrogenase, mitochondrial-like [Homalodisca vitripennis]|uniref:succinate-semialdehyde dehydrogenase, mitochondrial-like n=1 Tax=Homalodisca vitripennis TaxID=197043 RepID=UPI001EEA9B84|nr:succinate-semialdehyde dehydrogenase, mitochondrial-like [Homalodisca vitripennis]
MTFSVFTPSNGSEIAAVPDMDAVDAVDAIKAASIAFKNWSSVASKERAALLRRWFDILELNTLEIARVIALESGKPLQEAVAEVAYGNAFVEMFAGEATRIMGETMTSGDNTKQYFYLREPVGVVALITPWNFPHTLILRKAAAALAAGCSCVVKPAEDTPLTALALASTLQQAGFPKGVFNVITSSRLKTPSVGKVFCEHTSVAAVSFTGSTNVGKLLYSQCANTVKRLSLELGGNSPFIVFPSADVDLAVNSALTSKFRNCGQVCVSPNRFLVHRKLFSKFVDQLTWRMKYDLTIGSNFDPLTNIGPLINQGQFTKVKRLVEDAVTKGAKLHIGGRPANYCGPLYYEPTLLTRVHSNMDILSQEIFGPVVVCIPFDTEEEAITLAHDTTQGLAGYFFTQDMEQMWRVARRLEVGMVGVNGAQLSCPQVAFGGIKQSGFGREGAHFGIHEFTFVKTVCFQNS